VTSGKSLISWGSISLFNYKIRGLGSFELMEHINVGVKIMERDIVKVSRWIAFLDL
jgi:hypothetical protein